MPERNLSNVCSKTKNGVLSKVGFYLSNEKGRIRTNTRISHIDSTTLFAEKFLSKQQYNKKKKQKIQNKIQNKKQWTFSPQQWQQQPEKNYKAHLHLISHRWEIEEMLRVICASVSVWLFFFLGLLLLFIYILIRVIFNDMIRAWCSTPNLLFTFSWKFIWNSKFGSQTWHQAWGPGYDALASTILYSYSLYLFPLLFHLLHMILF